LNAARWQHGWPWQPGSGWTFGECLIGCVESQHRVAQDAHGDHQDQRPLVVGGVEHALRHVDIVRRGPDESRHAERVCKRTASGEPGGSAPRSCRFRSADAMPRPSEFGLTRLANGSQPRRVLADLNARLVAEDRPGCSLRICR